MFSSSRVASRGIMLADSLSDEFYGEIASGDASSQSLLTMEIQPSSTPGSASYTMRLRAKISRLWLRTVRCWPSVHSHHIFTHGICKFEASTL